MQNTQARTITVLGAGSSGQAIAAFLSLSGYGVRLWNRNDTAEVERWITPIIERGGLEIQGVIEGFSPIQHVTTDIASAIEGSDAIIVATTTDAYQSIGQQMAPHLSNSQPIILQAAGTLGSIDMLQGLASGGYTGELLIGETATTVFGSRATAGSATVQIAGKKENVALSTLPSGRESELAALVPEFAFSVGGDILSSGFNNTGAALHVVPMVLNSGWIESTGGDFLYYRDGVTPVVSAAIEAIDQERLAIAEAFGYEATSLADYLVASLGAPAGSLHDTIQGVAMYAKMPSPNTLDHRFLWEDSLAGVVPLLALAEIAGVPAPVHQAMATMANVLLGRDLVAEGRTTRNLSLDGYTAEKMKSLVKDAGSLEDWKQQASSVTAKI